MKGRGWKEEGEKRSIHLFLQRELRWELGRELVVRVIGAHANAAIARRCIRLF